MAARNHGLTRTDGQHGTVSNWPRSVIFVDGEVGY